MPSARDILTLVRDMRPAVAPPRSLADLARRAGWSRFHLHRAFQRVVGETPKQYQLRLQLERAAARLVSSDRTILDVATEGGFASHEVFTRAFRRHFGCSPASYRARALEGASPAERVRHAAVVDAVSPGLPLFHITTDNVSRRDLVPTLKLERRTIAPQPVLCVRVKAAPHEIAKAVGECLGKAYVQAQKNGLAFAGRPFTRYYSTGPGLFDLESGMPVASDGASEGDVNASHLPGGPVAVALHAGAYDKAAESYAALERWINEHGYRTAGAPWESYLTDPADLPDTADWRTEIFWPLAE